MKILAINASFRAGRGKTAFLADQLLAGAATAGAETERLDLSKLTLGHCLDCQRCQASDHFLKCVLEDDMALVYDKMRKADLIVFASPIYTFTMSSLLKTLFERFYFTADMRKFRLTRSGLFFHEVDDRITAKPFVVLAICDNLMEETSRNLIDFFRAYSQFMDAPMAGCLVRTSAALLDLSQNQAQWPEKIRSFVAAYHQAGQDLVRRGRIRRHIQHAANQDLVDMPALLKISGIRRILGQSARFRKKIEAAHSQIMEAATRRA